MINYRFIEKKPSVDEWTYIRSKVAWSIEARTDFEIAIQNTLFAICVYDFNKIIGMGRVLGDNKICFYIQDVAVIPEYQNQGIGQKIMWFILKYINSNASPNATIGLFSSFGKESFYEKFGFITRPNNEKGCGMYLEYPLIETYLNQYPNYIML